MQHRIVRIALLLLAISIPAAAEGSSPLQRTVSPMIAMIQRAPWMPHPSHSRDPSVSGDNGMSTAIWIVAGLLFVYTALRVIAGRDQKRKPAERASRRAAARQSPQMGDHESRT
jgi:hypothetical protein